MKQSFAHILTLFIRHQYFSGGLFKPMVVSLSNVSQRIIQNFGLLIKPFPGGFHLLSSNPDLPGMTDASEPLQFYFRCSDPKSINYTELPAYSLSDRILYFNNLEEYGEEGEKGIRLHGDEFTGHNELVPVVHEKISITDHNSVENYRFTDASGDEISSQNISPSFQNGSSFHVFDLPTGLILFHSEKNDVKRFFHYDHVVWKKPFAVFELFPGKLFHQFYKKGKVDYSINFSNRKTIWKYFLTDPVYNSFKNLSIINKGKDPVFNSPQKELIHSNSEALVFESKNKIPLAEQMDEHFQLVDNYSAGNGKGKVVLKKLPGASADQLYRDEAKTNETFYSHIFI
jgi:hypothetical protein